MRTAKHSVRSVVATVVMVAACVAAGPAFGAPSAGIGASRPNAADDCTHPVVPDWFHDSLVTAIDISGDLDPGWASSPYVPRIVCWQGSAFDVDFAPWATSTTPSTASSR